MITQLHVTVWIFTICILCTNFVHRRIGMLKLKNHFSLFGLSCYTVKRSPNINIIDLDATLNF
jgi:hypothetical protein